MELDPVGLRQPKDGVDAAGGPSLASLPKSLVMPRSSITAAISARAPSYRVTSLPVLLRSVHGILATGQPPSRQRRRL